MTSEKTVNACLVIIGNEILSGRTQDANLAYLAKGLNRVGGGMVSRLPSSHLISCQPPSWTLRWWW